MGSISVQELLKPISDSEPSGPNLEYAPEFSELERAIQGKPEQRLGTVHVPSEPPDWSGVCKLSLALFERTRDLRVAMHLAHGLLHCHGYGGFADGVEVTAGLVRDLWGSVHPELDHDDDDDPTMRITALAALASPSTLLALQSCPLAQLRGLGTATLQDVRALAGGAAAAKATTALSLQSLEAIFQEVELEALQAIAAAVQRTLDGVEAIDNAFITHTGSRGADLSPLSQLLREVRNVLKPRLEARLAAQSDASEVSQSAGSDSASTQQAPSPSASALTGEIRSREDVLRAIDKICAYYARTEPASPLPLLLERCKRLVSSSFLEIIQELAPESLSQVSSLAGRRPE